MVHGCVVIPNREQTQKLESYGITHMTVSEDLLVLPMCKIRSLFYFAFHTFTPLRGRSCVCPSLHVASSYPDKERRRKLWNWSPHHPQKLKFSHSASWLPKSQSTGDRSPKPKLVLRSPFSYFEVSLLISFSTFHPLSVYCISITA